MSDDEYRGRIHTQLMEQVRNSLKELNNALAKLQRTKVNKEYEIAVDVYTITFCGSNVTQIKVKIIEEV